QPGAGFNADPAALDPTIAAGYLEKSAHSESLVDFLLGIIPKTFAGAFVEGNLLQVLLIAVITGFACARLGEFGARVAHTLEDVGKVFFSIIHIVVKLAPIGAFGAMAFTIGKF